MGLTETVRTAGVALLFAETLSHVPPLADAENGSGSPKPFYVTCAAAGAVPSC